MVHKLLIVGAGFGGNGVIHGLVQASQNESGETSHLPKGLFPGDLEITMLDRDTTFSIGGTWQFVWSSRLTSPTVEWPLSDLQANHFDNVTLITGPEEATVEDVSTDQKMIRLTNGKVLEYDTLVLAPGVISDPSRVPGLPTDNASLETALNFCDFNHVPLIQQGIDQTMNEANDQEKTILVCVTRMPYKVGNSNRRTITYFKLSDVLSLVVLPSILHSARLSPLKWHRLLTISVGNVV
jgi:NADH dehydrogenase FAD-containing subunit